MTGPITASVTPLSEILGSTPEETAAVKPIVKTFKGIMTKMVFEYRPLTEDELSWQAPGAIEDNDIYHRKCNNCLELAEHAEVTEADPYYIRYLCTVCRDNTTAPPKPKVERETKMFRYAGFHRSKPSYTPDEFEIVKKRMEAKIQEAKEQNETATETESI